MSNRKRQRFPSREELNLSTPERIARKMLAVERAYELRAREWTLSGKAITPEKLRAIKDAAARQSLERDREVFATAPRHPIILSISKAAEFIGADDKSDRFIARFIDSRLIRYAKQRSRQRWEFDREELERLRDDLAEEARLGKARRKRRSA